MTGDRWSRLQLEPDAINALLHKFVDCPGKMTSRFEDGKLILDFGGLVVTIEELQLNEAGLELRLRLT
jgi:hypothetical protein